jgi:hypothetical protein
MIIFHPFKEFQTKLTTSTRCKHPRAKISINTVQLCEAKITTLLEQDVYSLVLTRIIFVNKFVFILKRKSIQYKHININNSVFFL